jgi:hypothetical protein
VQNLTKGGLSFLDGESAVSAQMDRLLHQCRCCPYWVSQGIGRIASRNSEANPSSQKYLEKLKSRVTFSESAAS